MQPQKPIIRISYFWEQTVDIETRVAMFTQTGMVYAKKPLEHVTVEVDVHSLSRQERQKLLEYDAVRIAKNTSPFRKPLPLLQSDVYVINIDHVSSPTQPSVNELLEIVFKSLDTE